MQDKYYLEIGDTLQYPIVVEEEIINKTYTIIDIFINEHNSIILKLKCNKTNYIKKSLFEAILKKENLLINGMVKNNITTQLYENIIEEKRLKKLEEERLYKNTNSINVNSNLTIKTERDINNNITLDIEVEGESVDYYNTWSGSLNTTIPLEKLEETIIEIKNFYINLDKELNNEPRKQN